MSAMSYRPAIVLLALLSAGCTTAADGRLNECIPVNKRDIFPRSELTAGNQLVCSAYRINPGALDDYQALYPEAFAGVDLPWNGGTTIRIGGGRR